MRIVPKDGAESWVPNMLPPSSFDRAAYQKRIDDIVGTRDGRPIVKLAWAPSEFRWMPCTPPTEPIGYTFPIFCVGRDAEGNLIAPPRWVLLERAEPQHYAHTWEATRYGVHDGRVWDQRGPCPSERYTELKACVNHDGECCPCLGDECVCDPEHQHCWGRYREPDEGLLDWIRKANYEASHDRDVDPNRDVEQHAAPDAQREWVNNEQKAEEKRIIAVDDIRKDAEDFFQRQPVSTFKKTESGIILLN